jgi:hypothetical protein
MIEYVVYFYDYIDQFEELIRFMDVQNAIDWVNVNYPAGYADGLELDDYGYGSWVEIKVEGWR